MEKHKLKMKERRSVDKQKKLETETVNDESKDNKLNEDINKILGYDEYFENQMANTVSENAQPNPDPTQNNNCNLHPIDAMIDQSNYQFDDDIEATTNLINQYNQMQTNTDTTQMYDGVFQNELISNLDSNNNQLYHECTICRSKLKNNQIELNCQMKHKLCAECYKNSKTFLEDKLACPSDTTKVDTVKF